MLIAIVDNLDGVEEKYKAFYTKNEETGKFHLDANLIVDNTQDVTGLKNNNSALKAEKLALQTKLDKITELEQTNKESGLEAEKKYDELLELKTGQFDEKIQAATTKSDNAERALKSSMINAAVTSLAVELGGENAELLKPHLVSRFQVNLVESNYVLQITDKTGKVSALSRDQLSEEFRANKMFKPLLKGRQSSGGGSGGGAGGGSNKEADVQDFFDPSKPSYSTEEQYKVEKENKPLHDKLVKKYNLDDIYGQAGLTPGATARY